MKAILIVMKKMHHAALRAIVQIKLFVMAIKLQATTAHNRMSVCLTIVNLGVICA